jgi:heme/copper-type cytochrome/quinol oxidase subunit 3
MTTPLALPPAGRTRPRNLINIATLVVVSGGTALFALLIAAYVGVGHGSRVWPPSGVNIDEYMGNMLALTAIMSAITVEWAAYAIKRDDSAQATWGLVLTIGFGVSFLLLLWQLGSKIGFGPGDVKVGPFAVLFFALIGAAGILFLLGLFAVLAALARTIGRQMTAANHEMIRATAWIWEFVVFCWIAVFATVWLFT